MNPFTKKEEKKEEGNMTEAQLNALKKAKDVEKTEGLPDELLNMLKPNLSESQQAVFDIVSNANEGILGLRPITIEYYRKTGEVADPHKKITPIVHTLIKKGYLYPIDGKKGVYTIHEGLSVRNEEDED